MNQNLVVQTLRNLSDEVYYVGGYVRDKFLGVVSKDVDIAADADANIVYDALKSAGLRPTVINRDLHVIQVKHDGIEYEIARFRTERYPKGGSLRPEKVEFIDDIEHDLARRDFTINSIALHVDYTPEEWEKYVVDPFGGYGHLIERTISAVGYKDPYQNGLNRFSESPIRIMRGIRLVSQLGFEIDEGTKAAMRDCAHMLEDSRAVPYEMIGREFLRMLGGNRVNHAMTAMEQTRVLHHVFPEMAHLPDHEQNPKYHSLKAYDHVKEVVQHAVDANESLPFRVAAFFHDIAKGIYKNDYYKFKYNVHDLPENDYDHDVRGAEIAHDICLNKLLLGKNVAKYVATMVRHHMMRCDPKNDKSFIKFIRKVAADCRDKEELKSVLSDLIRHKKYDQLAGKLAKDLTIIEDLKNAYDRNIDKTIVYKHEVAIGGHDVMKLIPNFDPKKYGKQIGEVLDLCLELVWHSPERNTKEQLEKYVAKVLNLPTGPETDEIVPEQSR